MLSQRAALWLVSAAVPMLTQVLVFDGATVVDGTGAPARATRVVVRDGRIAAVAADARGPYPEAVFQAGPAWSRVSIAFTRLPGLNPRDLTVVAFEIARPPGKHGWLELDNVRFY